MKIVFLFSIFFLSTSSSFAQVDDIELESLDDLSILEEFEKGSDAELAEDEEEMIEEDENDEEDEEEFADNTRSENTDDPMDVQDPLAGDPTLDDSFLDGIIDDKSKIDAEKTDEELALILEGEGLLSGEEELLEEDNQEPDFQSTELVNIKPFDEVDLSTPIEELQDTNEEINRDIINNFAKTKDSNVDGLIEEVKLKNEYRYSTSELKILKVHLHQIAKSPIKVFQVQRGTKLIRISDNKVVYTPKSLTVRAHILTDHFKNKYIINKKGNLLYKVHFQEISDIARVTNLYRAPTKFIRIKKKLKKVIYDDKFDYSLKFKLHTGLNSPEYTNSFLSDPSEIAPMLRTEVTLLSNTNFFFESGLTFMYESVSGSFKSNGKYSISSFSFGPSFKSKPLIWNFGAVIQARVAAYSRVSYTKNNISNGLDLSETSLLTGLEKEKTYKGFGHYLYGFNMQRKWIKTNAKTVFLDVGSHVSHDDSFALYVGHRSDWIW
jgi:hypothetical protein